MARKPVKVITDLQVKKRIKKVDNNDNILFDVSGTLANGHVSSSLPITSSYFVGDGSYLTNVPVVTSGNISGSGIQTNPIFLKDPLIIGTLTSSYIYSPQITGNLYGTASYADNAGNIDTDSLKNVYKRLRYQEVGYFDIDGSAIIELPTSSYGGNSFSTSSFDFVNANVFIKEDERWINDLVSVQMYTSSTNIYVELSAPALDNTNQYKIIVVNENPDDYDL
jgi:hypothetical protein